MKKIKAISLTMTILIMALIFFFSSQNGEESAVVSNGLTMKIIEVLCPDMDEYKKMETAEEIEGFVRKTAHFTIYLSLGFFVIITLKSSGIKGRRVLMYAMLICSGYACTDEIHQNFVSGREMKLGDVFIDSLGALAGIGLFFVIYKIGSKYICGTKRRGIHDC